MIVIIFSTDNYESLLLNERWLSFLGFVEDDQEYFGWESNAFVGND